ncbi:MAG: hypothetical protein KC635_11285 [Myxococcales bacterium]|nr:hypothetical protein [Myxococcales bacterium]MCB9737597.1 hypothetical protein [Deltaproteobacteria bacterium]
MSIKSSTSIPNPSLAASTRTALMKARYGVQEDGSGIPRLTTRDTVSISAGAREAAAKVVARQAPSETSEARPEPAPEAPPQSEAAAPTSEAAPPSGEGESASAPAVSTALEVSKDMSEQAIQSRKGMIAALASLPDTRQQSVLRLIA